MTLDEAIKRFSDNAEYERSHGSLQGCLEFRQLAEWLTELKKLKEQAEPCKIHLTCTDEEIANSFIEDVGAVKDQLEKQPCEDAISRQAVLDYVLKDNYYNGGWFEIEEDKYVEWLKALPSVQPKQKWISVSERLPEIRFNLNSRTSDTVFVCLENSTMHMAFYCDDDVWRFCESGEAKEPMWDKVIAWMPLPEPYKTESGDNE